MTTSAQSTPGVAAAAPAQTAGFCFNHTMIRVKDPATSLDFYTRVLGMKMLRRADFPAGKFSLFFLCYVGADETVPEDEGERQAWLFARPGVLELTHNWGTEQDAGFKYHDGNSEPRGFGHLCVSVPDLDAAVKWFDDNGITYVKRPEQGTMRGVAFIKDPDGYWVEILQPGMMRGLGSAKS